MVGCKKNVFFQQRALNLIVLNKHIFTDSLNCVLLLVNVKFSQVHAAEGPPADLLENAEVFQLYVNIAARFYDGGGTDVCLPLRVRVFRFGAWILGGLRVKGVPLFLLFFFLLLGSAARDGEPIYVRVKVIRAEVHVIRAQLGFLLRSLEGGSQAANGIAHV